jgi:phosphopantothenoylcysteine decarboxylase/phosphopantothenate--cysteine ligase
MRVLIGVCGGIAAYKSAEVVSKLVQAGCEVDVSMTPQAERFITALTFSALTGRATQTLEQLSQDSLGQTYAHLYPATEVDVFALVPATANTIGSIANGLGTEPVSNGALSLRENCKRIYCPAMNTHMWKQPAVQRNCKQLKEDGWIAVGPESGRLACGSLGMGRLADTDIIIEKILQQKG